ASALASRFSSIRSLVREDDRGRQTLPLSATLSATSLRTSCEKQRGFDNVADEVSDKEQVLRAGVGRSGFFPLARFPARFALLPFQSQHPGLSAQRDQCIIDPLERLASIQPEVVGERLL